MNRVFVGPRAGSVRTCPSRQPARFHLACFMAVHPLAFFLFDGFARAGFSLVSSGRELPFFFFPCRPSCCFFSFRSLRRGRFYRRSQAEVRVTPTALIFSSFPFPMRCRQLFLIREISWDSSETALLSLFLPWALFSLTAPMQGRSLLSFFS